MSALLAERRLLPADEALPLIRQVAAAVRDLHEAGLLHRAISPDAVALDAGGRASLRPPPERPLPDAEDDGPPELRGQSIPTIPAQIRAAREALAKSGAALDPRRIDVYQLGVLLCRITTGTSAVGYLRSPRVKALLPAHVQALIDRSLGYDPTQRFADADEFLHAVDAALRGEWPADGPTPASGAETPPRAPAAAEDTDPDPVVSAVSDRPPGKASDPAETQPAAAALPFTRLGHYEILERIGRGGMGEVYRAYEPALNRAVAVKVLPADLARHEDFVRRFHAEASAAARITHPHIIPIYFIGEDAGHHFFAMEFVEGETLADLLARRGRLTVAEALAVVQPCLAGLAAAHARGLVHRDVKPGNILLDRRNQRVLLADFGLAKAADRATPLTATGMVLGTADYLAPEQAHGRAVDGRADLYAVGVVLYQMLSGRLPFRAASATALMFQHAYEKPAPLCETAPDVPAGLSAVVDRLLAKAPEDRYPSAELVAADLWAVQAGVAPAAARSAIVPAPPLDEMPEPALPDGVEPPPRWWQKLAGRARGVLRDHAPEVLRHLEDTQQQVDGAIAEYQRRRDRLEQLIAEGEAIAADLTRQIDSYGGSVQADAAAGAVRELEKQRQEQQEQLDQMCLGLAKVRATLNRLTSQRDLLRARLHAAQAQLLLAGAKPPRRRKRLVLGSLALGVLATAVLVPVWAWVARRSPASLPAVHTAAITSLAFSPDGAQLVSGGKDGRLLLWDVRGVRKPLRLPGHSAAINAVAFSPLGNRIASCSGESGSDDNSIRVWDVATRRELRRLLGHRGPVYQIIFSADGTQLLSGGIDGVRLWDVQTETELRRFDMNQLRTSVSALAWSRDGQYFLIGVRVSGAPSLALWDASQGKEVRVFSDVAQPTESVALSPDGRRAASLSGLPTLWDLDTGKALRQFGTRPMRGGVLAFSDDGRRLLSAGADGTVRLWDVDTAAELKAFTGHTGGVWAVAFAPGGDRAASAGEDMTLRLWDLPPPAGQVHLYRPHDSKPIVDVAFLPNDFTGAALNQDGKIYWLDLKRFQTYGSFVDVKYECSRLAVTPDGTAVLYATALTSEQPNHLGMRPVRNTPATMGRDIRRFEAKDGKLGRIHDVVFSLDQRFIYSGGQDGFVRVWETRSELEVGRWQVGSPVHGVALSSDGSRLLTGGEDQLVRVWDVETKQEVHQLKGHAFTVLSVAVAATGGLAASGSADRTIRLWDVATGTPVATLSGHEGRINRVAFSPDGRWLLSASDDRSVRLWSVPGKREAARFDGHGDRVRAVAFSSDGRQALSGGDDRTVRLWDLTGAMRAAPDSNPN